jgi:hypothetical protein
VKTNIHCLVALDGIYTIPLLRLNNTTIWKPLILKKKKKRGMVVEKPNLSEMDCCTLKRIVSIHVNHRSTAAKVKLEAVSMKTV